MSKGKELVRRWGPLLGVLCVSVEAILRGLGHAQGADLVGALTAIVGLNPDVATAGNVSAAILALTGVALKIASEVEKARKVGDDV